MSWYAIPSSLAGCISSDMRVEEEDMKVMSKLRLVFTVFILLLVASCTSRSGGTITEKGNTLELKTKEHVVKAIKGNVEQGTYVVFGARSMKNPESVAYVDGKLAIMPQSDFDRFKAEYGDFRQRTNKGFREARKTLRRITVIGLDGPTQDKIKEFIELKADRSRKNVLPVVKLTMTELRVMELKYKKNPVFLSGDVGKQFLISKIEVLKEESL